jgi:hypothetical protein
MVVALRPLSIQMRGNMGLIGTYPVPFQHMPEPSPALDYLWLAWYNVKKTSQVTVRDTWLLIFGCGDIAVNASFFVSKH